MNIGLIDVDGRKLSILNSQFKNPVRTALEKINNFVMKQ